MATKVVRIDPQDLLQNVSLGIALPFNGPAIFKDVYTTKDRAKYRLINLILTNEGERLYNPQFGCKIRKQLFEPISSDYDSLVEDTINKISIYIPEITNVTMNITEDTDNNLITISISYNMTISGTSDQIKINFE